MFSHNQDNHTEIKSQSLLTRYLGLGLQAVSSTFKRFPITLILFLLLTAIFIYRIETPYEKLKDINEILDRISGVLALGIPFSLSISLLMEKLDKGKNIPFQIFTYLAEVVLLYLYYLYLFPNTEMVSVTRLLMVTLALILSFLFIPYLPKREYFEIYITNIVTSLAATAFYTIVLALGLTAILFAIKSLLFIGLDDNMYAETWILAWLVFAPLNFLFNLPFLKDNFTPEHFNKVIKIMLLYIALPIITVYTLVLYAYFSKIIVTQVWPKGIVSYLVVSYTAAGITAIFLVSPFREQNKWVKVFTTAFTKLIFPLLGMMFISIAIRIGEFGFTENRYFILIIGLWSTFIMIYLNFRRFKNNTLLPVSLAIVALLTVFGPWNAFQVSKSSQSQRFYTIASKYDMIEDGKVVTNNSLVETRDQQEISGVLRYFNQSHQLSDLKYLPENFTMEQMKTVFGFSEVYSWGRRDNYFSYGAYSSNPVTIEGYDFFFRLDAFRKQPNTENIYENEIKTNQDTIKLVLDSRNMLKVSKNSEVIYQHDLMKYVNTLYEKYGSTMDRGPKPDTNQTENQDEIIFIDETSDVKVMLLFNNINGSINLDNNELNIDNISGELFLRVK